MGLVVEGRTASVSLFGTWQLWSIRGASSRILGSWIAGSVVDRSILSSSPIVLTWIREIKRLRDRSDFLRRASFLRGSLLSRDRIRPIVAVDRRYHRWFWVFDTGLNGGLLWATMMMRPRYRSVNMWWSRSFGGWSVFRLLRLLVMFCWVRAVISCTWLWLQLNRLVLLDRGHRVGGVARLSRDVVVAPDVRGKLDLEGLRCSDRLLA